MKSKAAALGVILSLGACAPTIPHINEYVNRVPYKTDMELWGKEQHLGTPEEFFRYGGDCEDYVFTKQHELRRHGHKPGQMMFVTTDKDICHMVLKVEYEGEEWIMDNLVHGLQPVSYLDTFKKMGCDFKFNKEVSADAR